MIGKKKMNKIFYIWKIVKDRWLKPYDDIILRFNTKAEQGNPLIWRVFVNGIEYLASEFEIHGYVYSALTKEQDNIKYNVGCKGRIRWEGSKAVIITPKKANDIVI
jgi:hypothetical protein